MGVNTTSKMLLVLFAVFGSGVAARFPSCLESGITWGDSSMMSIIPGVPSPEACQDHCAEESGCQAFTWTSDQFEVFPLSCALFHNTASLKECHECISGPSLCMCSENSECEVFEDNLITIEQGMTSETECQDLCYISPECTTYTYFDDSSPLRHLCMLFYQCEVKDTGCIGCKSGPKVCDICDFGDFDSEGCSPTTTESQETTATTSQTTTITTTTTTQQPQCPDDWTKWENFCYWKMTGYKNRDDCRKDCNAVGGELASIHLQAENDLMIEMMGKHHTTWLGGTKVNGKFEWLDGTEWSYDNWHNGQPNGGDGDCVYMGLLSSHPEQWHDGHCSTSTTGGYNCMCRNNI